MKIEERWAKTQPKPKEALERQLALLPVTMEALRAKKLSVRL